MAKSVACIVGHGALRETFTVLADIPLGANRAHFIGGRCTGKNFIPHDVFTVVKLSG